MSSPVPFSNYAQILASYSPAQSIVKEHGGTVFQLIRADPVDSAGDAPAPTFGQGLNRHKIGIAFSPPSCSGIIWLLST